MIPSRGNTNVLLLEKIRHDGGKTGIISGWAVDSATEQTSSLLPLLPYSRSTPTHTATPTITRFVNVPLCTGFRRKSLTKSSAGITVSRRLEVWLLRNNYYIVFLLVIMRDRHWSWLFRRANQGKHKSSMEYIMFLLVSFPSGWKVVIILI